MIIDDRILKAQANNLTLVRLVLASAVILSHAYWQVNGNGEEDPLTWLLGQPISTYAVDGFFFLSGFLVYPSLIKRNDVASFAVARLMRLWPGLAVSVGLTILVGAFLTRVPIAEYLTGPTAAFAFGNLSLTNAKFHLTGIQCGDVLCNINGSLWTLPREAQCYLALVLLFLAGLAKPAWMLRLVLPATVVFALVWHLPGLEEAVSRRSHGLAYALHTFDRLWVLFAAGIAASILRPHIRLSWGWLALLFGVTVAAEHLGFGLHVRTLFVGYAVLCFGFLTARNGAISARWPDYSYGIYIYAFPVMIAAYALWPNLSGAGLALVNFLLTLPFAIFSWHCVESPFLRLASRRAALKRERAAAA